MRAGLWITAVPREGRELPDLPAAGDGHGRVEGTWAWRGERGSAGRGLGGGTWPCGGHVGVRWGRRGREGQGDVGPCGGPERVGPGGEIWATFTLERKAHLLSCSRDGRHYSSVQAALQ